MQFQPRTPSPATSISRRSFAMGLGGFVASILVGQTAAKPVSPKSTIKSVKQRVKINVGICEQFGGVATVTVRPGGTSVSCEGGFDDGSTCVHSTKRTRCYQGREAPPELPEHSIEPISSSQ